MMAALSQVHDTDLHRISRAGNWKYLSSEYNNWEKIALQYLKTPQPLIDKFKPFVLEEKCIEEFKFKMLEHWRDQNPVPDARKRLFGLLEEARKRKELLDVERYRFLMFDLSGKCALCNRKVHLKICFMSKCMIPGQGFQPKAITGLDRKSAHPLQLHAAKQSCCTAAKLGATGQLSPW